MAAVLVTGATGFVGQKLVRSLLERGDSVSVTSRSQSRGARTFGAGVPIVEWDGRDVSTARAMLADVDAVVHLAGANVSDTRWSTARVAELRESRTAPTRVLARALAETAGEKVRAWLSASAVGIYGTRKDDKILDESGSHGKDTLASICEDWEGAADDARAAGVRVAHPRIGLVLGSDGGMLKKMLPPFRLGVGGPLGDGEQFLSWIHQRDAVGALLFALDHDVSGPFNVTAPTPVTMNVFAAELGRALHRPALMRVPALALRVLLGAGLAEAVLSGQRALPVKLRNEGYHFVFPDLWPALADIVGASS